MKINKENANIKVENAIEQGFIYVLDIDNEIVKIELCKKEPFDKRHRCFYIQTNCGLVMPVYACDYGIKKWLGWALTKEELESGK